MEPNFSFQATRLMMAFWGQISDERLTNIFRFEEKKFLTRIKIVFGDEYLRGQFKYRTNVEIASLFAAWCFELESKEEVEWIVRGCVREECCGDLDTFWRMTRDGVGFVCPNGTWLHISEFKPPPRPYLLWSANCNKEVHRAYAQIGMHEVKEYLKMWEKQELKLEIEKWGDFEAKSSQSGGSTSTKRKRGCSRKSRKRQGRRTLWISFPPKDNNDIEDSEE